MKRNVLVMLTIIFGLFLFIPTSQAQIDQSLLNKMTGNSQLLNDALGVSRVVTDSAGVDKYIGNVIGVILSFAGVIFLVLMIIAGYSWITAQGSEEKITKAKQLLINGTIGLVVSFGAFILINAVIMPLSNKYFAPTVLTSVNNGGAQTLIPCNNSAQCADQTHRQLCIDGNCLECQDDVTCFNYYGNDKPICDTINNVCVISSTALCTSLSKTTCLARTDCRLDYNPKQVPVEKNNCYNIKTDSNRGINNGWCNQFDGTGKQSQCEENSLWCAWEGTVVETQTVAACIKKTDYKCSTQCQGSKPFCLASLSPTKCVECRDDNDCAGNLLAKKCSVSTGNHVCVPF